MDTDKLKNIPAIGWALVVAGAALGGALLHSHRLIGGLIGGGVAFAFEYSQAPCCGGCAAGVGCGGTTTTTTTTTGGPTPKNTGIVPPVVRGLMTGISEPAAGGYAGVQQDTSTVPLFTSDPEQVNSTFDPVAIFTKGRTGSNASSDAKPCKGCA